MLRHLLPQIRLNHPRQCSSTSAPVKLAFERHGTADDRRTNPLVIGHGLFGQKRNWNSLGKQLQKCLGNQVYTVDFRNHGDSPHTSEHLYPDMVADLEMLIKEVVLDESGFERVFLLGHSMGGKVAAQLAIKQPPTGGLIEKLIIEDVSPHRSHSSSEFLGYIRAMKAIGLDKTRKQVSDELKLSVPEDSIRLFLLTNLTGDGSGNRCRWKCNLDALERGLESTAGSAVDPSQGHVFLHPTLIVAGANSSYITPSDQEPLKKLFLHSEFVTIPNAGHWLHSEQPQLFIDCVVDFLGK